MYASVLTIIMIAVLIMCIIRGAWLGVLIIVLFIAWGSNQYSQEGRQLWNKIKSEKVQVP